MKTKNKEFDSVGYMRIQREKLNKMTKEEVIAYFSNINKEINIKPRA